MSIIDLFLSKLAPYECLNCGIEGELACSVCIQEYLITYEECYRCRNQSAGSLTCVGCLKASSLYRVQAPVIYQGLAKDLVWCLKSSGAQAAALTIAQAMLPRLDSRIDLIVPAPTATGRVRQRGYDQSRLVARQLSRLSNIPWADCLHRSGQAHQVGSDKNHRLNQLESAFMAKNTSLLHNAHILLVDDVITTGATIESAALTLKKASASQVEAIAFARPSLRSAPKLK